MKTDDLKPCPFCGEVPEDILTYSYGFVIQCWGMHCEVEVCATAGTPEEVVKIWNTRPPSVP